MKIAPEKMAYERLDAESKWPEALLDLFWAVDDAMVRGEILPQEVEHSYRKAEEWRERL